MLGQNLTKSKRKILQSYMIVRNVKNKYNSIWVYCPQNENVRVPFNAQVLDEYRWLYEISAHWVA